MDAKDVTGKTSAATILVSWGLLVLASLSGCHTTNSNVQRHAGHRAADVNVSGAVVEDTAAQMVARVAVALDENAGLAIATRFVEGRVYSWVTVPDELCQLYLENRPDVLVAIQVLLHDENPKVARMAAVYGFAMEFGWAEGLFASDWLFARSTASSALAEADKVYIHNLFDAALQGSDGSRSAAIDPFLDRLTPKFVRSAPTGRP